MDKKNIGKEFAIQSDPIADTFKALVRPIVSIAAAASGAVPLALLSESVGMLSTFIEGRESERQEDFVFKLSHGLADRGITIEKVEQNFSNLSPQDKASLLNLIEESIRSARAEKIASKREIVRRFLEETIAGMAEIKMDEREYYGSLLIQLELIDYQVLHILKNGAEKMHPGDLRIPKVIFSFVIASIIRLENFALIDTVKQGMSIGGELVKPATGWWVGISKYGSQFYDYALKSNQDQLG